MVFKHIKNAIIQLALKRSIEQTNERTIDRSIERISVN